MKRRDIAIIGYYETKFERRSGRSIYDVAGEAASGALAHAGGAALVVTSAERAQQLGARAVHPVGYAEITNFNGDDPTPDVTETGFSVVYSYTVTHLPPEGFAGRAPYVLVSVDLPEGVRMLGTLLGVAVEDVRTGMPVCARYERLTDDITLVQFTAERR